MGRDQGTGAGTLPDRLVSDASTLGSYRAGVVLRRSGSSGIHGQVGERLLQRSPRAGQPVRTGRTVPPRGLSGGDPRPAEGREPSTPVCAQAWFPGHPGG